MCPNSILTQAGHVYLPRFSELLRGGAAWGSTWWKLEALSLAVISSEYCPFSASPAQARGCVL